ncbi:MAG: hypothetical protein AAF710_05065 [Planctomycetota bacterium]
MVKAVVWGGMLIMILGGMFFGMQALNADTGELVGYAVAAPDANNECELQVVVSLMAVARDGPTVFTNSGKPDWNHWLGEHFTLTDDAGTAVDLKKGGFKSKDINEMQAGTAEFIALAPLEAGKTYTLTYTPVVGQLEQYTQTIAADAKEFRRENFVPDY